MSELRSEQNARDRERAARRADRKHRVVVLTEAEAKAIASCGPGMCCGHLDWFHTTGRRSFDYGTFRYCNVPGCECSEEQPKGERLYSAEEYRAVKRALSIWRRNAVGLLVGAIVALVTGLLLGCRNPVSAREPESTHVPPWCFVAEGTHRGVEGTGAGCFSLEAARREARAVALRYGRYRGLRSVGECAYRGEGPL